MYCSNCGKQLDTKTDFCKSCSSKKKGNVIAFWVMIYLAPLLIGICDRVLYHTTYYSFWSFWDNIGVRAVLAAMNPTNSCIGMIPWLSIFVVIFVLCKKIKPAFFDIKDVVVITAWRMCNYALSYISLFIFSPNDEAFSEVVGVVFSGAYVEAYLVNVFLSKYFLLSAVWELVCFLIFLLVRSKAITFKKKAYFRIGIGMIIFTIVACVLRFIVTYMPFWSPENYSLVLSVYTPSAFFVGIRYMILMFFFICLATKKVNLVGGMLAVVGAVLIEGAVVFMSSYFDNMFGLNGISETAGIVFIGIVTLIAVLVEKKRSKVSVSS